MLFQLILELLFQFYNNYIELNYVIQLRMLYKFHHHSIQYHNVQLKENNQYLIVFLIQPL